MNHHDSRKIAHHFPPFDEEKARQADYQNRIAWQETLRERRRCLVLVVLFLTGIAALVYVAHLNRFV